MKHALAALALVATPAHANGFKDREIAFQALNAIDAAQTCIGVAKGLREVNPLFGKHPSCEKVIGIKVAAGIIHYLIADSMNERDAKTFQIVSLVVQGGVVAANLRFAF